MMNTRVYLLHGDPCIRCPDARRGQPPRAAVHHGLCMPCWLGANESERDAALLDELLTPAPIVALDPKLAALGRIWNAAA